MDTALGIIETKGLIAAIEAADAMVKAASVKIIGKEKVTGALIVIKIIGETAAVKSAVDAGAAAAQRVGELVSAHVIPRPDDQIDFILYDNTKEKISKKFSAEKIKHAENDSNTKTESTKDKAKEKEIILATRIDTVTSPAIKSKKIVDKNIVEEKKDEEAKVSQTVDAKLVQTTTKEKLEKPKAKVETKKLELSKSKPSKKIPPLTELEILNVHSLRRIARSFDNFPIKGREISKASRGQLLDYFNNL